LAALTGISPHATVTMPESGDDVLAQRRKQNMRDTFLAGTPYETDIRRRRGPRVRHPLRGRRDVAAGYDPTGDVERPEGLHREARRHDDRGAKPPCCREAGNA
jgi:hypothetical protein